jgi:PHD/YefM family antitoxin component YafN of YafNO toxin-antitoxin module
MSTVTVDEVRNSLPELLERVRQEPVSICDGDRELAILISPKDFELDHLRKVERFEATRDAMVLEMERKLAQDGMTMEQFVRELLA